MKNELLELREILIATVRAIDESGQLPTNRINRRLSKDEIITVGAKYYGATPEELKVKARGMWAKQRQVLCAVLYNNMEGASYPKIAPLLGYVNHGTVMHHVKIVNEALDGSRYGYDDVISDYKEILRRLYVTE